MEITIEDLIQAREEALYREELIRTDSKYKQEISILEAKIMNAKLKLETTEREIPKIETFVDQVGAEKAKIYKNLIEENKMLKRIHSESFDLKIHAQLTQNIKELFKKKYEEAIIVYTSSDPLLNVEDQSLEIKNLQQKLEEIETQVAEIIKEKDYMKKKVIPVLESTLKLYEKNKAESEERIEELKNEIKNKSKKKETHSASPVASKNAQTMNGKTEASKLLVKNKSKTYMPSYLSHSKPNIRRSERNSK